MMKYLLNCVLQGNVNCEVICRENDVMPDLRVFCFGVCASCAGMRVRAT